MSFNPGKGTASGQVLTWDGAKFVWAAVSSSSGAKPEGEWKRLVDRTLPRPITPTPFLTVSQNPNVLTDIPTDYSYQFSLTGSSVGHFNRFLLVHSGVSSGQVRSTSSALNGAFGFISYNLTGSGWKFVTAANNDVRFGASSAALQTWIFVTGGPTDNQLVRMDSNGTIFDTLTIGTSITKAYFDGFNIWTIAGGSGTGQLYYTNVWYNGVSGITVSSKATGMTYSTARQHFATDGLFTYVLDTGTTSSIIYKMDVVTGNVSSSGTFASPNNNMTGIAYDGRYLWMSRSDGSLRAIEPSNLSVVTSVAAPTLRGALLTSIEEIVFDGEFIVGVGSEGANTRNVLFRFDPVSLVFPNAIVGPSGDQYSRLQVVPGDRAAGNVYYLRTATSIREIYMVRELTDQSVGGLWIEGALLRRPGTLNTTTHPSPITLECSKSIYMVETNTYASGPSITLPDSVAGHIVTIKDLDGVAATKNITITNTVDGVGPHVINTNYGFVTLMSIGVPSLAWWYRL